MILHLLQDGIRLNLEFVEYDLNYNMCFVGRLEGHGLGYVISGFVSVFYCSQFSPLYIYIF